MRDEAHEWTDEQIEKLERRILRIYEDAARELEETVYAYFEKLKSRDAKQRAMLEEGKITEEEYKLWRIAQIGRGTRVIALRDKMAERYTNANETAVSYINDQTPSIYSLNRNYMAYTIEQVHGNVGFTLLDESTVRRLIVDQPDLMPNYPQNLAVKRGIDLDWGKQQITASITSSILQGKNLGRMADDMQRRMKTMNRDSAIRTARTAYTTAQNAGRQDAFEAAEKLGIKVRKRWIATKDNRTRHDHGAADGQIVDYDKPFIVGGYSMMYPGDGEHGAPGRLIYNCRCTMRTVEKEGIEQEPRRMRVRDPVTGRNVVVDEMTYAEWKEWVKRRGG